MKAIIIDLDGTIANCEHRLHLIEGENKDWDKFFQESIDDSVYKDVLCIIHDTVGLCSDVKPSMNRVFITGRSSKYEDIYNEWLNESMCDWELLCRSEHDYRPAHEVKQDLLNKYRNENPDVEFLFALDDDIEACEMYRKNGILALHVMRPTS